jgi:YD repeat-containing protein
MKTVCHAVSSALLALSLCVPGVQAAQAKDESGRAVLVSRNPSGRIRNRTVLNGDGSRHVTATEYWPQTGLVRRTTDEDVDRRGRPTGRTSREFDVRGRLRVRQTVSIDASGHEHATVTRISYDAQGRGTETTSAVER